MAVAFATAISPAGIHLAGGAEFALICGAVSGGDVVLGGYPGSDSVLNIDNGGTLDIRGINAFLYVSQTAYPGTGTVNVFDGGTLHSTKGVEIDAAGATHATINGNSSQLYVTLALESTLAIDFSSTPTIGDEFVLVQTWNALSGVFGNVNVTGLDAGQQLDVVYDTDNEKIIAKVTAVPEPGSIALLGLGGLLVARRRRA